MTKRQAVTGILSYVKAEALKTKARVDVVAFVVDRTNPDAPPIIASTHDTPKEVIAALRQMADKLEKQNWAPIPEAAKA